MEPLGKGCKCSENRLSSDSDGRWYVSQEGQNPPELFPQGGASIFILALHCPKG